MTPPRCSRGVPQTFSGNLGDVGKVTFDDLDAKRLNGGLCLESSGRVNGATYQARVLIADYDRRIQAHYRDITAPGLGTICATASIPFGFRHFGVLFAFDRLTEIDIHDGEMVLHDGLRSTIHACRSPSQSCVG